jgi:hypothetical protein
MHKEDIIKIINKSEILINFNDDLSNNAFIFLKDNIFYIIIC